MAEPATANVIGVNEEVVQKRKRFPLQPGEQEPRGAYAEFAWREGYRTVPYKFSVFAGIFGMFGGQPLLLLVKRKRFNFWEIPGALQSAGDDEPEDAARRSIRALLGKEATLAASVGEAFWVAAEKGDSWKVNGSLLFLFQVDLNDVPAFPDDIAGHAWVSLKDVPPINRADYPEELQAMPAMIFDALSALRTEFRIADAGAADDDDYEDLCKPKSGEAVRYVVVQGRTLACQLSDGSIQLRARHVHGEADE